MLQWPQPGRVSKDYYEIKRDDNSLINVENTNAQDFSNVKVYASDPWYDTFDGTLENLVYTNQGTVLK